MISVEHDLSRSSSVIYTISGLVVAALAWSYFSFLDVNAVASGKIQPAGRTKVIQPMAAGKVSALHVANGDHVNEGDVLVELDSTKAVAAQTAIVADLVASRAEIRDATPRSRRHGPNM